MRASVVLAAAIVAVALFVLGPGQSRRITAKLHHLIPGHRTHPYRFTAIASVPGSAGYPGRRVRVRMTLAP
jgi:hypothetical protein